MKTFIISTIRTSNKRKASRGSMQTGSRVTDLRMRSGLPILFAIITIIATSGCAARISKTDLLRQIETGTAPPIIDVRSTGEFEEGHVPGAIHIPFYSVIYRLDEIPSPEGKPVVVYCTVGVRAAMARAAMWGSDIDSVAYLEGHMSSWCEDDFPIESLQEGGSKIEEDDGG